MREPKFGWLSRESGVGDRDRTAMKSERTGANWRVLAQNTGSAEVRLLIGGRGRMRFRGVFLGRNLRGCPKAESLLSAKASGGHLSTLWLSRLLSGASSRHR